MIKLHLALPQELLPEDQVPELMVDGVTRDDIKQGILGDCWFLSACAAVSQHETSMKKVLSVPQSISSVVEGGVGGWYYEGTHI